MELTAAKICNAPIHKKSHIRFMKTATINDLKLELSNHSATELKELCLRLAKFKKENKELLTYLLFEAGDEEGFIEKSKSEITAAFKEVHPTNLYLSKKTIRKILRICVKYIRYAGSVQVEIELLICFCTGLQETGIPFQNSPVLVNLYKNQVKKIQAAISTLHEDLQYDYSKAIARL
jgi:hypothetical protein